MSDYDTFVFNHIPKCGGTSFRGLLNASALSSGIDKDKIYIPGFNGLEEDKNIDQLSIREKAVLRRKEKKIFACHSRFDVAKTFKLPFGKIFYFTILRNPVKRFLSHYNFFYYKHGYMDCKGILLNDLSEEKLEFLLTDLSNIHCKYLAAYRARDIYIVRWENVFRVAKYNLQYEYAAYGILEEMNEMLPDINKMLPEWLTLQLELPSSNTQKYKKKQTEVKPEILDRIKVHNKLDLDLYQFAKDFFKFKMSIIDDEKAFREQYNYRF